MVDPHRANEERLDMLGDRVFASPEQYAAWNLQDRLAAIDTAETALRRGCTANERIIHLATLGGMNPGEARRAARAKRAAPCGR